jgi:hypothetical protein
VNENTNFNIILNQHHPSKERDAHFLISVKKSKKDRKGSLSSAFLHAALSPTLTRRAQAAWAARRRPTPMTTTTTTA